MFQGNPSQRRPSVVPAPSRSPSRRNSASSPQTSNTNTYRGRLPPANNQPLLLGPPSYNRGDVFDDPFASAMPVDSAGRRYNEPNSPFLPTSDGMNSGYRTPGHGDFDRSAHGGYSGLYSGQGGLQMDVHGATSHRSYSRTNSVSQDSRDPSISVRGSTPVEDSYQQGRNHHGHTMTRGFPHPTYLPQSSASSYGTPAEHDPLDSPTLSTSLHRPASLQQNHLSERIDSQDRLIEALVARIQALEDAMDTVKSQSAKPKKVKEGSNDHPTLKPLIHPMFGELCGLDMSSTRKTKLSSDLASKVKALPDGKPFETSPEGRQIWHPNFLGAVDDEINIKFINEVAQRIFDNETSMRAAHNSKGNIPDEDFQFKFMQVTAKAYFRNIHTKVKILADPNKARQAEEKQERERQRTRRATAAKNRRTAALDFQRDTGYDEAIGMIDTEFGTDLQSYESDDLSEGEKCRRADAGVGKQAPMGIGRGWRHIDYITFCRWLTLRYQKSTIGESHPIPGTHRSGTNPELRNAGEPPTKCRKTVARKVAKNSFDVAPHKMHDEIPHSLKGTKPFMHMVDPAWLARHPEYEKELLPGADWLVGFGSCVRDGDLLTEDMKHVQEVERYRAGRNVTTQWEMGDAEDADAEN